MTIRRKRAEIDADRIEFLLSKKYAAPMYAFMPQLRNGTGFSSSVVRTADAVAFSLWPSRGLYLHGFEIKVNRGDWLNEMKRPEKAEEHAQFCQYWSLVIAEGIADPMEVPLGWGLIVASQGELTEVRKAPQREPVPLTQTFIAAMFRNVNESIAFLKPSYLHVDDIDERVKAEAEKEAARQVASAKRAIEEMDTLRKAVKEFEKASGIQINEYTGSRIGEAVNAIMRVGVRGALRNESLSINLGIRTLETSKREIDETLARIEATAEVTA